MSQTRGSIFAVSAFVIAAKRGVISMRTALLSAIIVLLAFVTWVLIFSGLAALQFIAFLLAWRLRRPRQF